MTTTTIPRRPSVPVGERVELARYTVPGAGERVIWGQRVAGVVRVTDCPSVPGQGRSFLVERELEQDGSAALHALLADYLAVAEQLRAIPMAGVPLDRYLEHLDEDARE